MEIIALEACPCGEARSAGRSLARQKLPAEMTALRLRKEHDERRCWLDGHVPSALEDVSSHHGNHRLPSSDAIISSVIAVLTGPGVMAKTEIPYSRSSDGEVLRESHHAVFADVVPDMYGMPLLQPRWRR